MVTKSSKDWNAEIPNDLGFYIMDPDGWDRKNYEYSFNEELITKIEFLKRMMYSTCMSNKAASDWISDWSKK